MGERDEWYAMDKALIALPEMYSTDGDKTDRPAVYLFGGGDCAWILWEHSDGLAFGLCDLGLGFPELGSVSINELKELRFPPFGLKIEMDRSIDTLVKGYEHRKQPIPNWLVRRGEQVATWFQCHRDGEPKGKRQRSFDAAWMEMHWLQGQSVDWAFKYEGWSIEEVTADGTIVTSDDN